jgi:hypothetical protein
MIVNRWGLHNEGEFTFLHEPDQSLCLNAGMADLASPFRVVTRATCPHAFLTGPAPGEARPRIPRAFRRHPLVVAMSPIEWRSQWNPSWPPVFWGPSADRGLIETMTALSCLGPPTVFAAWSNKLSGLGPRLLVSNLSPVVIVGYEMAHLPEMQRLLTLPRLRPLVFCGSFPPPGPVTAIAGPLAVARLPLRDIGWHILRKEIK